MPEHGGGCVFVKLDLEVEEKNQKNLSRCRRFLWSKLLARAAERELMSWASSSYQPHHATFHWPN